MQFSNLKTNSIQMNNFKCHNSKHSSRRKLKNLRIKLTKFTLTTWTICPREIPLLKKSSIISIPMMRNIVKKIIKPVEVKKNHFRLKPLE